MLKDSDPFGEQKLTRLQLIFYLFPLVGWIPSLWTFYHGQGTKEQRSISRLSLTLTLGWVLAYGLLQTGSTYSNAPMTLRLLYTNGLITSGYILLCLGLMIKVWQGKSVR